MSGPLDIRQVLPLAHAYELQPGSTYLVAIRGEMITPADIVPLVRALAGLNVNAAIVFLKDEHTLQLFEASKKADDVELRERSQAEMGR